MTVNGVYSTPMKVISKTISVCLFFAQRPHRNCARVSHAMAQLFRWSHPGAYLSNGFDGLLDDDDDDDDVDGGVYLALVVMIMMMMTKTMILLLMMVMMVMTMIVMMMVMLIWGAFLY